MPSNTTVDVRLGADAVITRGHFGPVADLTAFSPGEPVVAAGVWSGSMFVASMFQSLYRAMQGEVIQDDGFESVMTSAGHLKVPPEVRTRDGVARTLQAGDRFFAEIWSDTANGESVAATYRRA